MSSVESFSPFQTAMPDEVNLHILSHLDKGSMQAVARTSTRFKHLANDFQIWKHQVERDFGKVITEGVKQSNKSWKQTHDELSASKEARDKNKKEVSRTLAGKTENSAIRRAFAGFGLNIPLAPIVKTEQVANFGGRTYTVLKRIQ